MDGTAMMAMRAHTNTFLPRVARARRVDSLRRVFGRRGNSSDITSRRPAARRVDATRKGSTSADLLQVGRAISVVMCLSLVLVF